MSTHSSMSRCSQTRRFTRETQQRRRGRAPIHNEETEGEAHEGCGRVPRPPTRSRTTRQPHRVATPTSSRGSNLSSSASELTTSGVSACAPPSAAPTRRGLKGLPNFVRLRATLLRTRGVRLDPLRPFWTHLKKTPGPNLRRKRLKPELVPDRSGWPPEQRQQVRRAIAIESPLLQGKPGAIPYTVSSNPNSPK